MNALKRCILVLLATGWMVLMTGQANAAVCFAGDQSCGGAASFDGTYVNPVDDAKQQCLEAGFTLGSECTPQMGKQITGYCPYNSEYVTCCGLEYAYSGCVYPYVDGAAPVRCGKKYRCKCDPVVYKYDSIATCRTAGYLNARPGGTSCTHVKAQDSVSIQNELLFKDCVCDRGLYPYSQKDCNTNGANADEAGSKCISNITDGEGDSTYYASCKCDLKKYPETNDSCEFGGTGKHCVQSGLWFFENCCSCQKFPAKGTRERGPDDPNVDRSKNSEGDQVGYDICPCVKGYTRFKIKKCNEGWEPNPATYDTPAGSKCQPISCVDATKLWLKKNPTTSYGYFDGTSLKGYDASGNLVEKPNSSQALVDKDINVSDKYCSTSASTVCYQAYCKPENYYGPYQTRQSALENGYKAPMPIDCPLTDSIFSVYEEVWDSCARYDYDYLYDEWRCVGEYVGYKENFYTCARWDEYTYISNSGNYGLACIKPENVYSSQYVANSTTATANGYAILRRSCTASPTITYTGSSFPMSGAEKSSIFSVYGVNINFKDTVSINRSLFVSNATLSSSFSANTVTFNKNLILSRSAMATGLIVNPSFNINSSLFKGHLSSNGFNFNITRLDLAAPSTSGDLASITLGNNQIFRGGAVYIYPITDGYNSENGLTSYPVTAYFTGPSTGLPAQVYTSIYIGMNGTSEIGITKSAKNMTARLSGGLNWNRSDTLNGSSYTVGLSTGSKIHSSDYGSQGSNYAKITSGEHVFQICEMAAKQCRAHRHRGLGSCSRSGNLVDDPVAVYCSISASGSISQIWSRKYLANGSGGGTVIQGGTCDIATQWMKGCVLESDWWTEGCKQQMFTCR